MNPSLKSMAAVGVCALLATTAANAQLKDGNDGSSSTSVFISLVERDATNTAVRNLTIDTGVTALDLSDNQIPWSTTAAQETDILAFVNSATGMILFNVGAALTDQTFATDLQAAITSGLSAGPNFSNFASLGSAIIKTQNHISNANFGTFNANGVQIANGPTDFGFHDLTWGNSMGGGIAPSNEIPFGADSVLQQWRLDLVAGGIVQSVLGDLTSNAVTGDISFGAVAVPVPAAAWLFGSALGLLGWARRRAIA